MSRRSLSNLAGPVRVTGAGPEGALLAEAWERAAAEPPDVLTHGFHTWPARMHWAVPRTLLAALPGRTVLDPFCGGGTVVVEARVAGKRGVGVDLDPLARRVADVRSQARPPADRLRLLDAARAVAAASEARVRGRVPIIVDLPKREVAWYAPHILKELGGLLEEIRAHPEEREALEIVFSAIVVKCSKQRAETSDRETARRLRKGLPTEFFLRKAEELVERMAALTEVARGPRPLLFEGDARRLPQILGGRRVELVVTSPPYGGTYDYATHHARRVAWLGLDPRSLHRHEVGARRRARDPDARARWDRELGAVLRAVAATLTPGGHAVLVQGDGVLAGQPVPAVPQVATLAAPTGLAFVAAASQPRRGGREEHLIWLRRGPS